MKVSLGDWADVQKIRAWILSNRTLVSIIVGVLLLAFGFVFRVFFWPHTFDNPSERAIYVSAGTPFSAVVDSLERNGIITDRWSLNLAARVLGGTHGIRVGKYVISSGISNVSLLSGLNDGSLRRLVPLPIPEGLRMRSVASRVERILGGNAERFMTLCSDSSFLQELGIEEENLEGYLLPDTYSFHWQTPERDVIRDMVSAFKRFYVDSLVARQAELKMSTRQVLTLASIVEAESMLDEERPVIAGVYHNRLKLRMRLEADPTIQYILPDGPRRLLYEDLQIPSPYNTYRHYGLPPGPINNPGRKAILATLYPESHSYLFFVADGTGGHRFSATFSEHRRAVRDYRRVRRQMQLEAMKSEGSSQN